MPYLYNILLSFCLSISLVFSVDCSYYECSKDLEKCTKVVDDLVIVKQCDAGFFCQEQDNIAKCLKIPEPTQCILPGYRPINNQKCCYSATPFGICKGKALGETCSGTNEANLCDVGLYCDAKQSVCNKMAEKNGDCATGRVCQPSQFCYFGACRDFFSLPNGEVSDDYQKCVSGHAVNGKCQAPAKYTGSSQWFPTSSSLKDLCEYADHKENAVCAPGSKDRSRAVYCPKYDSTYDLIELMTYIHNFKTDSCLPNDYYCDKAIEEYGCPKAKSAFEKAMKFELEAESESVECLTKNAAQILESRFNCNKGIWSEPIATYTSAHPISGHSMYMDIMSGIVHIAVTSSISNGISRLIYLRLFNQSYIETRELLSIPQEISEPTIVGGDNNKTIMIAYSVQRLTNKIYYTDTYFIESYYNGVYWLTPIAVPRKDMEDKMHRRMEKLLYIKETKRPYIFYAKYDASSNNKYLGVFYVTRSPGSEAFSQEVIIPGSEEFPVMAGIDAAYTYTGGTVKIMLQWNKLPAKGYESPIVLAFSLTNGVAWNITTPRVSFPGSANIIAFHNDTVEKAVFFDYMYDYIDMNTINMNGTGFDFDYYDFHDYKTTNHKALLCRDYSDKNKIFYYGLANSTEKTNKATFLIWEILGSFTRINPPFSNASIVMMPVLACMPSKRTVYAGAVAQRKSGQWEVLVSTN